MTTATTSPAGASGTANPVASADTSPVVAPGAGGLGDGVALIVGNRPDALPGETTVLLGPARVGSARVGSGMGGRVGSASTLAGAVVRLPEAGAGVCWEDGCLVAEGAGVVLAGLAVGEGERVGVGVATETAARAAGGVHGSTVGTLAVAESDTEVPAAEAGTCATIWTLDAEPSTFMVAIQHDADPSPSGQPDVYVAVPDGCVLSATVTSAVSPFSTETVTANVAAAPGWTLAPIGSIVTQRSASVRPCIRTH